MSGQLSNRLSKLERDHRRLKVLTILLVTTLAVLGIRNYAGESVRAQEDVQTITVSRINVVDEYGVVRLRIGANLPDGVINGVARPRGHEFAGILLYDETGQERSGYGTMGGGNVGLTLDTRSLQSALFVAGPDRGAALRMWDGQGHAVDLRVDENGPSLHATTDGRVTFHEPVIEDARNAPFCRSLQEAASRVTSEELLEACRARRSEASCQACLSE